MSQDEDNLVYKVVVNHEEQYSLWPASRANALGWNDAGKAGSKEECLEYIKEVWTDMRPLSVRQQMTSCLEGPEVNAMSQMQVPLYHPPVHPAWAPAAGVRPGLREGILSAIGNTP